MSIDTSVHKSKMSIRKGCATARLLTGTAAILAAMVVRDLLNAPQEVFVFDRITKLSGLPGFPTAKIQKA